MQSRIPNYVNLFTSKANTLEVLCCIPEFNIPALFIISANQWQENKENIISNLLSFASNLKSKHPKNHLLQFAVRSSCKKEDNAENSGAGAFLSLLNVNIDIENKNNEELYQSIEKVFASYGVLSLDDQVLIQPMVESVLSGVITTRVLADGSPYYVINYDDESGKTDTITSGTGASKTVYIYKNARMSDFDSPRLYSFIEFAGKIESICESQELDIEFCMDKENNIYLLQVRPLCTHKQWIPESDKNVANNISFVIDFLEKRISPHQSLFGKSTILGCMPDWNPAEMIGITPRPLAHSLYRNLITQRVWSQAREIMGYKAMPPEELMILLAGRPYIDVRVSFNSFLPKDIDSITGEAFVNAWIERLDEYPFLHDKIEFEIAQTAINFCFDQDLDTRYPHLLTKERRKDFRNKLTILTTKCMNLGGENQIESISYGSMPWAFNAITELKSRQNAREIISSHKIPDHTKILSQIVLLAEECRQLGTLPFSILARHAFIAESLLRSAVTREAISSDRLYMFKKSIKTVSSMMSSDFQSVNSGKMPQTVFINKYGHLRPSTYDILSPHYRNRAGLFDGTIKHDQVDSEPIFMFTFTEEQNLKKLLQEAQLPDSVKNLENYARQAIAGRELAKFIFTRNVSDILELVVHFGREYGLDRQTLSFIDIRDIMEWACHALLRNPTEYFTELAEKGRHLFDVGRSLKLGYLIRSSRDIYVVPQHRNAPNFVGKGQLEAPVLTLSAESLCSEQLDNRIICIESADPGFDWIFTRPIAGLITKFGGTNSHMAIRCAEYGLPAAIGVGDLLFEQVTSAQSCILNIDSGVILPL